VSRANTKITALSDCQTVILIAYCALLWFAAAMLARAIGPVGVFDDEWRRMMALVCQSAKAPIR
jgi:hypothetical protein